VAAGILRRETSLVAFKLNEVIPWGRSFEEWRRMFFLTRKDRAGRILGCGDGPASFNTGATLWWHKLTLKNPIGLTAVTQRSGSHCGSTARRQLIMAAHGNRGGPCYIGEESLAPNGIEGR
jgi:hypothetical protein